MEDLVVTYFSEMDNALTQLSQHKEGRLNNLLPWNLCYRNISIGKLLGYDYYLVKAIPEENLLSDSVRSFTLTTEEEIYRFLDPLITDIVPIIKDVCITGRDLNFGIAGEAIYEKDDNKISKLPVAKFDGIIKCFNGHFIQELFSPQRAKEEAVDLWNNTENGLEPSVSFLVNLENIFSRFSKTIKLKAFKERRVHRFINSHASILLPPFKNLFFEHKLVCKDKRRVADFILERETTFPSLLIELESPVHKVFKNKGDFTAPVNHARDQISEWVSFIENESANCIGEMRFLTGLKQRLIVIGRGLENLEEMIESKHTDTMVWTYDLLLKEARERWHNILVAQCSMLDLPTPQLLYTGSPDRL